MAFGVFLVLFALGMLGGSVRANEYIPREAPIPQSIRWQNATPTGANTSASAAWMNAAGQTTHHRFPVHVSAGTLGALANGAIRRGLPLVGWGLTLKSAVEAAGWAIDELGQQVTNMPVESDRIEAGERAWCVSPSGVGLRCTTSVAGAMEVCRRIGPTVHAGSVQPIKCPNAVGSWDGVGRITIQVQNGNNQNIGQMAFDPRTLVTWEPDFGTGQQAVAISEEQIGQLIKNLPQVVNGVLVDPQTGAPIRTPELAAAVNALGAALAAAHGLPAPPPLDPSEDLSAPVPSQTEWPGFCDWATTICEFVEWVKEDSPNPEKPEVPIEEMLPEDIQQSWSSGLGGGSCPAPYSVPILDGSFEISWQGICGFVDMLRPLLITIALVVGACIVAGVRVGKNA